MNPETATRALIRGFSGRISDLAFAHKDSSTLACVDEGGNLYIWNVSEENQSLGYPGYCKCCLVCSWVAHYVLNIDVRSHEVSLLFKEYGKRLEAGRMFKMRAINQETSILSTIFVFINHKNYDFFLEFDWSINLCILY